MIEHQHKFSILFVDNDPSVMSSAKRIFSDKDYRTTFALSGREILTIMENTRIDVAFIDPLLLDMESSSLFKILQNRYPLTWLIIQTAHNNISDITETFNSETIDHIKKPMDAESLRARIKPLYEIWKLREENQSLKHKMGFTFGFDQLVGNSPPIQNLKEMIRRVGPSDGSVLIQGESGTEKELVARAIHHYSSRRQMPVIPVDCSSISDTALESELFGHVKGTFNGLHNSNTCLIRSANGGTLYLDNVSELTLSIQEKLLSVIQDGKIRPVGSYKSYKVNPRVIASTHRNLTDEVSSGHFHKDLLHRLNVLTLNVPPLRDRKEDIPLLSRYFIKRFKSDFSVAADISKEALSYLEKYDWPGNVRELENTISRAMTVSKVDSIMPVDLANSVVDRKTDNLDVNIHHPPEIASQSPVLPSSVTMAAYEKAAIVNALASCENNRKKAADMLEIGEATIYRKIKKYSINLS